MRVLVFGAPTLSETASINPSLPSPSDGATSKLYSAPLLRDLTSTWYFPALSAARIVHEPPSSYPIKNSCENPDSPSKYRKHPMPVDDEVRLDDSTRTVPGSDKSKANAVVPRSPVCPVRCRGKSARVAPVGVVSSSLVSSDSSLVDSSFSPSSFSLSVSSSSSSVGSLSRSASGICNA